MKTFTEYEVTIDGSKLGFNEDLQGVVIGEATAGEPIIGKSLIVLLDKASTVVVGRRGIVIFECQVR